MSQCHPGGGELLKIPSHKDYQQFAQKVQASFEVPKVHNQMKKVDNDHTYPSSHPSIGKYHFLLLKDGRFGT